MNANRILAVIPVLLLAACATTVRHEAALAQWVGKPLDALVLEWGPPQGSYTLRDGRQVIEYRQQQIVRRPGWGRSMLHSPRIFYLLDEMDDEYSLRQCSTRFIVDAQGIIQQWAWDGNDCRQ